MIILDEKQDLTLSLERIKRLVMAIDVGDVDRDSSSNNDTNIGIEMMIITKNMEE